MVEYLYDTIRAVSGQEIKINAYITDENENIISEGCYFVLHDGTGNEMLLRKNGNYVSESLCWEFLLAPEETKGLNGKYFYCIQHEDSNLCFKQPIYLLA